MPAKARLFWRSSIEDLAFPPSHPRLCLTHRRRRVGRPDFGLTARGLSLSSMPAVVGLEKRSCERGHADSRNRRLSRSSLARPNIDRFSIFKRLMWPSTGPLLQGSIMLAFTAS
jgi:hypothetical protein